MDDEAFIGRIDNILTPRKFGTTYCVAVVGYRRFIVTKGKFYDGQEVVVIGKDCLLPSDPNLEQLKSYNIQFADDLVSDGMIAPMHILGGGRYPVGQDVTKVLGIKPRVESHDIGDVQWKGIQN